MHFTEPAATTALSCLDASESSALLMCHVRSTSGDRYNSAIKSVGNIPRTVSAPSTA